MMLVAKQVADAFTVARGLVALLLVLLGLTHGADGLPLAAWLMIAAWTSDSLDGPIARSSRIRYRTWVGDHDLEVDMAVAGGLLIYLLAAGYVDLRLAGIYLLIWALIFWRWGVPSALGMLVQAPIYGWFIWVAVRDAPAAGWWLVGWILLAVVLTWPRFPKEIVPGFLAGMREVWEAYRRDGA
jgi:phosphatidylglycerophosphate synthase